MSEFLSLPACQQSLHKLLVERDRIVSQPVDFADCKRLCERCLLFNDPKVLGMLKEVQLVTLEAIFEGVHRFIVKTTKRSHFRDMVTGEARRRYCSELAELNEKLTMLGDSVFSEEGVDDNRAATGLALVSGRSPQRRAEDIEDYQTTLSSLAMHEMESILQQGGDDVAGELIALEKSIQQDVGTLSTYLSVRKMTPLSSVEKVQIEGSLQSMSMRVSMRRSGGCSDASKQQQQETDSASSVRRIVELSGLRKSAASVQLSSIVLGKGGFGKVVLGRMNNREVAVKIIENLNAREVPCAMEAELIACIENEILLMRRVTNPSVMIIYAYIVEPKAAMVIMELSPYGSLGNVLRHRKAYEGLFPLELCLSWFVDMIAAIDFVHSNLVQHRDIKPDNWLVFPGLQLKLTDFGLSKEQMMAVLPSSKVSASMVGTGAFIAPEIRNGKKSEFASDVFSFAMTCVQILTRKMPSLPDSKGQLERALQPYHLQRSDRSRSEDSDGQLLSVVGRLQEQLMLCLEYQEGVSVNLLRPSPALLTEELQGLLERECWEEQHAMSVSVRKQIEDVLQGEFQQLKANTQQQQPSVLTTTNSVSSDKSSSSGNSAVPSSLTDPQSTYSIIPIPIDMSHVAVDKLRAFLAGAEIEEEDHLQLYITQFARKQIYNVYVLEQYCLDEDGKTWMIERLLELDMLEIHAEDVLQLLVTQKQEKKDGRRSSTGIFGAGIVELLQSLDILPAESIAQEISLKVGIRSLSKLLEKRPWELLGKKVSIFQQVPLLLKLLRSEVDGYVATGKQQPSKQDDSESNKMIVSEDKSVVLTAASTTITTITLPSDTISSNSPVLTDVTNISNTPSPFMKIATSPTSSKPPGYAFTNTTIREAVKMWCRNIEEAIRTYGDIATWATSNVTNMEKLFADKTTFNDNIEMWNISNVKNMGFMFHGASSFNQSLEKWNVSNVTNMNSMFYNARSFNQPLDMWNVGNVTNMYGMFHGASSFNQPLEKWNVSNVTNMSSMFYGAGSFNQLLEKWNVSNVTNMGGMFDGARSFNQQLDMWNVSNITNMNGMFHGASSFNQPLEMWDVSNVTNMYGMFHDARSFNQLLEKWDVSNVTDMRQMFYNASSFNQPLEMWDVSNVTNMNSMFRDARSFNQPLEKWNISNVTSMNSIFHGASKFNQPLEKLDFSNVADMSFMFNGASSFNQPLDKLDVSNVTNMGSMFSDATNFNQPLEMWNVSNVTNMGSMFLAARSFNQPLEKWDVSNVTNMGSLFNGARSFNQPLEKWNVCNVTNMAYMFSGSSSLKGHPRWYH